MTLQGGEWANIILGSLEYVLAACLPNMTPTQDWTPVGRHWSFAEADVRKGRVLGYSQSRSVTALARSGDATQDTLGSVCFGVV